MLTLVIGILIIVVVGAVLFWVIDKFCPDARLAQLLKLPGRVSYAGPRPTHRLRRWPWFAKPNGGYENDEAWLRQKAPTGEDRRALLAVRVLGSDSPSPGNDTPNPWQRGADERECKNTLLVITQTGHDAK